MFKWWKTKRAPKGVTEPVITIAKTFWEEGRWQDISLLMSEKSDFIYNNVSRRYQSLLSILWSGERVPAFQLNPLMSDFIQDAKTGMILCRRYDRGDPCPSEHLGMTDEEHLYLCQEWRKVADHRAEQDRLKRREKLSAMYEEDCR